MEEQLKQLRDNYANTRVEEEEEEENTEIEEVNKKESIQKQLQDFREKFGEIEDNSVSGDSSRSNSGMSSCPSTETSSVLMDVMGADKGGVTDTDISRLREWLSHNK